MLAWRTLRDDAERKAGAVLMPDAYPRHVMSQLERHNRIEPVEIDATGSVSPVRWAAAVMLRDAGHEYAPGTMIPNVTSWPSFHALRNMGKIVIVEGLAPERNLPPPAAPVPASPSQRHTARRGRS